MHASQISLPRANHRVFAREIAIRNERDRAHVSTEPSFRRLYRAVGRYSSPITLKKVGDPRARRWLAELLLVFLGVYAAFWLSGFKPRQQRARHREPILASLESLLREGVENTKAQAVEAAEERRQFQQALERGPRPKLRRFTFTIDCNPGDMATILQAGGIELLDVKNLTTLRAFESIVRWGLSRMAHCQKLSDN